MSDTRNSFKFSHDFLVLLSFYQRKWIFWSRKKKHGFKWLAFNFKCQSFRLKSFIHDHKLSTFFFAAIRIAWIHRPAVTNSTSQTSITMIVTVTVSLINFAGICVWTTRPKARTCWKWVWVINLVTLRIFTTQLPVLPPSVALHWF